MTLEEKLKALIAKKMLEEKPNEDRINMWQDKMNLLQSNIHDWLNPYCDGKYLTCVSKGFKLSEEALGEYEATYTLINVLDKQVIVEPVATFIVGGFGRVDMHPVGMNHMRATFILSGETMEDAKWMHLTQQYPAKLVELDNVKFEVILANMIDQ